jgi:hypothetical protein
MQLTDEQKRRFREYLEKRKKQERRFKDKQQNFQLEYIDYIGTMVNDLLSKMENLEEYQKKSEKEKENIETNLRLEFLEFMVDQLYIVFEQNGVLETVQELGKDAQSEEELLEILMGLVATEPVLADVVTKAIVVKYGNLCEELDVPMATQFELA